MAKLTQWERRGAREQEVVEVDDDDLARVAEEDEVVGLAVVKEDAERAEPCDGAEDGGKDGVLEAHVGGGSEETS